MGAGKKLQALLKQRGISIANLSRDTKISVNTLYALIKRDSNINATTLEKIAFALNLTIDELNDMLTDKQQSNSLNNPELYVINTEFEKTLKDTQEILDLLNKLTKEYEYSVYQLRKTRERYEALTKRKYELEKELLSLSDELKVLENDIANRNLELSLIRNKLAH